MGLLFEAAHCSPVLNTKRYMLCTEFCTARTPRSVYCFVHDMYTINSNQAVQRANITPYGVPTIPCRIVGASLARKCDDRCTLGT